MEPSSALARAIDVVGSQAGLARMIGIRSPSISGWIVRGKVPAERCAAIERATSGLVTRYDLRPDVFGDPPQAQKQVA
ncbi:MAG: helix-turn-helix domain-containing protein [Dokdonella sp.]|nr:helix-turn-helix domain-containing protein [Dokdonella sp.]